MGLETLSASIDGLMAGYLADACPCRFPRFRATVGRDTAALFGVAEYVTPDQQRLIMSYDALVPLSERSSTKSGWQGRCTRCDAHVVREDIEFEMGPARHLFITPRGAPDVGAPFEGAIPQVHGFFPLERGSSQHVVRQLDAAFPRMDEAAWVAWMAERAA